MKITEQTNIIRTKRSNRDEKKEYCQKLTTDSLTSEFAANQANVFMSAAGSANILGVPVGTVMASPSATLAFTAYSKKFFTDLEYINQDCSSIPFDEIKETVTANSNRNLEAIEKNLAAINRNHNAINRNYNAIQLGFIKSEAASNKINQVLQKTLQSVRQSKIADVTSRLITFIESFIREKNTINHLPVDQLIAKLEGQCPGGILYHLERDATSPASNSLHILLNEIINREFAIPENSQDKVAFTALKLLYLGIETYVEIMFFLLQGHIYLANIAHQKSDIEAYNRHFNDYLRILRDFEQALNGIEGQYGLIDKTAKVLEDVKKSNFFTNEKEAILMFFSNRINALNQIKDKLIAIKKLPQAKPTEQIRYSFRTSEIPTPIGEWQDGKKVSYAIQYKDNAKAIYSQVGDWSMPYTVLGKANPQLDIGTAPDKITRLIFRRFDDKKPELVGIVKDSHQSEFRDINRDLYNAALEPNKEIAKNNTDFYIKNGADIHALFEGERQVIHAAAQSANIETVLTLIKHGVNINAKDINGYTPVHIAAEAGYENFAVDLTRLSYGGNINALSSLNWTPLHVAAYQGHENTVKKLLRSTNIDLNASADGGFTPLHLAVSSGNNNIVNILMQDRRMNVNAKSKEGLTALHLACINGNDAIVQTLLSNSRVNIHMGDKNNLTAIHFASIEGHLAIINRLILKGVNVNIKSSEGSTPLILATFKGKLEVIKFLIENAALPGIENEKGVAAIDAAALMGHSETVEFFINEHEKLQKISSLEQAMSLGNLEITKLAIVKHLIEEKKLNFNANYVYKYNYKSRKSNNSNQTLFHLLAEEGYLEIFKYFISLIENNHKKSDFNIKDIMDNTPLHLAASSGHLELVKYLIENKSVAVNDKNFYGDTPLHSAASAGHLEVVKYFIENKMVEINDKNRYGNTLLHLAASAGHLEVVKYLIKEKYADFNIKNDNGNTALHLAARYGHLEAVKYLIEEKYADANIKDNDGNTLLHLAARSGRLEVVKYLVEDRNTDLKATNNEGYTPLRNAILYNNNHPNEVTQYLESKSGTRYRRTTALAPLPKKIDAAHYQVETDVLRNDPHSRSHLVGNGGEHVAKESNAQVRVVGSYYKDSRQSVGESAAYSIEKKEANKSIWEMVLPIMAGAGTLFIAGMGLRRYQRMNRLRASALPMVAALPLLPPTAEAASMNNEVALANIKAWDKVLQMDGCILGAIHGDKLVPGVTCFIKSDQMIIFPKDSDIKLEKPEGKFFKESCRPIEFNGRPSVYCEGEESNMVYTPGIFEPPLERINGLLMLFQVGLHQGKKLYHWLLGSPSEETSEALSPVISITTEQKTIWIGLLVDIEMQLVDIEMQLIDLGNMGKVEDELLWIRHILEDRREEYRSLSQKSQASLEDVTALTENLKALQAELELMGASVSTSNHKGKKSNVRKEDVSKDSNPWAINTSLLSSSTNQRIGFKSCIAQNFFKVIHQPSSTSLPLHAMNSTMINASAIQQQCIGGR